MAQFDMHVPDPLTGDAPRDIQMLQDWGIALVDVLSYMFAHLNEGNVQKAASVDAENINTNKAQIKDAQIQKLRADKISAGTLDLTHGITIQGEQDGSDRYLSITENTLCFVDEGIEKLFIGKETVDGRELFVFRMARKGESGEAISTIWIDNDGAAHFAGTVESSQIISSQIFSSEIYGISADDYVSALIQQAFAQLDHEGLRIMVNDYGTIRQKAGLSSSADGNNVLLVLGEGDGSGAQTVGNVTYSGGSFMIEKTDLGAVIQLVGKGVSISFSDGEDERTMYLTAPKIRLTGDVYLNDSGGRTLTQTIQDLQQQIDDLKGNGGVQNVNKNQRN